MISPNIQQLLRIVLRPRLHLRIRIKLNTLSLPPLTIVLASIIPLNHHQMLLFVTIIILLLFFIIIILTMRWSYRNTGPANFLVKVTINVILITSLVHVLNSLKLFVLQVTLLFLVLENDFLINQLIFIIQHHSSWGILLIVRIIDSVLILMMMVGVSF